MNRTPPRYVRFTVGGTTVEMGLGNAALLITVLCLSACALLAGLGLDEEEALAASLAIATADDDSTFETPDDPENGDVEIGANSPPPPRRPSVASVVTSALRGLDEGLVAVPTGAEERTIEKWRAELAESEGRGMMLMRVGGNDPDSDHREFELSIGGRTRGFLGLERDDDAGWSVTAVREELAGSAREENERRQEELFKHAQGISRD